MINCAGMLYPEVDKVLSLELESAGIEVVVIPEVLRSKGEVKTIIRGGLQGWQFTRAWYYWIAKGPGIPLEEAMALHDVFGTQIRVDGDCTAPSPLERFKGLGCGIYHVDTQEGLNALAGTILSITNKYIKR